MTTLSILAVFAVGYAFFLVFVFGSCLLAGRADARHHTLDEHGEALGIGGGASFHDQGKY